jgi:hypothetical protein
MKVKSILLAIGYCSHSVFGWESENVAAKYSRDLITEGSMGDFTTIMEPGSEQAGLPYSSLTITWESCVTPGVPVVALVTWGTHAANLKANNSASMQFRDKIYFHQDTQEVRIRDRNKNLRAF